jgi:hypothetical protein
MKLEGRSEGKVEMLQGYALAYFALQCGAFVLGSSLIINGIKLSSKNPLGPHGIHSRST